MKTGMMLGFEESIKTITTIASELLLQAERIDAARAYQLRMLNKVVPADQLMDEVQRVAERIASFSSMAARGMKESMIRGEFGLYGGRLNL